MLINSLSQTNMKTQFLSIIAWLLNKQIQKNPMLSTFILKILQKGQALNWSMELERFLSMS